MFNFSDLVVELDGHSIKAHKFVLAARSDTWGVPDLGVATNLDLSGDTFNKIEWSHMNPYISNSLLIYKNWSIYK